MNSISDAGDTARETAAKANDHPVVEWGARLGYAANGTLLDDHTRTQDAVDHLTGDVAPGRQQGAAHRPAVADPGSGSVRPVGNDRTILVVEDVDLARQQVPMRLEIEARLADVAPVTRHRDRHDLPGLDEPG